MGVPARFITGFPERCETLIRVLDQPAREMELLGTFSVLAAAAAFIIPFARISEPNHPLADEELAAKKAIAEFEAQLFLEATFLKGMHLSFFRYADIVTPPNKVSGWKNEAGVHPIQSTEQSNTNNVLRTVRNALAHGNIAYLDKDGSETAGNQVKFLAFVSRHRDNKKYRIAVFTEESFFEFLKAWINWLKTMPHSSEFNFDEAA